MLCMSGCPSSRRRRYLWSAPSGTASTLGITSPSSLAPYSHSPPDRWVHMLCYFPSRTRNEVSCVYFFKPTAEMCAAQPVEGTFSVGGRDTFELSCRSTLLLSGAKNFAFAQMTHLQFAASGFVRSFSISGRASPVVIAISVVVEDSLQPPPPPRTLGQKPPPLPQRYELITWRGMRGRAPWRWLSVFVSRWLIFCDFCDSDFSLSGEEECASVLPEECVTRASLRRRNLPDNTCDAWISDLPVRSTWMATHLSNLQVSTENIERLGAREPKRLTITEARGTKSQFFFLTPGAVKNRERWWLPFVVWETGSFLLGLCWDAWQEKRMI